jgi:hypothetical protein
VLLVSVVYQCWCWRDSAGGIVLVVLLAGQCWQYSICGVDGGTVLVVVGYCLWYRRWDRASAILVVSLVTGQSRWYSACVVDGETVLVVQMVGQCKCSSALLLIVG